jgi:hypothetical protein
VLVALASWSLLVMVPSGGLDPSWEAALYMAAHRGLLGGTQVVFTYGPLGFLAVPGLWYSGLGALAFAYSALIYIALCVSLVWALRRALPWPLALIAAYVVFIVTPSIELPLALTVVWCLALLSPEPPRVAGPLVCYGGAVLGALETLILLRSGPVILVLCTLTLLGGDRRLRRLGMFAGCALVTFLVAWFGAGQTAANLPDYFRNGLQVVLGYSQAMGAGSLSHLQIAGMVLLSLAVIVFGALGSRTGRARWIAVLVIGVAAFALFKEAIVREDDGHLQLFYSTLVAIAAAIGFRGRRAVAVPVLIGLIVVGLAIPRTPYQPIKVNPLSHARSAADQLTEILSPAHKRGLAEIGMAIGYRLDPTTLALLRGQRVDVDPWEAAVAWLYKLDWDPLPVFQDYSAYTAALDRLNAGALRAPSGPQRILRENVVRLDRISPTGDLDYRLQAWDPPAQALAMLCHFAALHTNAFWQVLGRVPDRCGPSRLLATIRVRNAQTISLGNAPAGSVLFVRIEGAGVTGIERLRSLLYRARDRYLVVNRTRTYRLVPGTAADGLLLDAPPNVDFPAPFRLSPDAHTIQLLGSAGQLVLRVYSMPVVPARAG